MEGLTEGRIVHYILSEDDAKWIMKRRAEKGEQSGNLPWAGQHYPAIVVAVFKNEFGGKEDGVNLQVFLDGYDTHWVCSRKFTEPDQNIQGTWHWIEKA